MIIDKIKNNKIIQFFTTEITSIFELTNKKHTYKKVRYSY